jgi:hypothetical protein
MSPLVALKSLPDAGSLGLLTGELQLNQIESPHEHALVMPAAADALKQRDAVLPARDRLPVNDAGARP